MASTDTSTKGGLLHKLKSQKQYKKITDSKEYKDADYETKNKMLKEGGSQLPKKYGSTFKKGGSVKKKKSSRKAVRGGGCEIR
jgi:hypothetical protein